MVKTQELRFILNGKPVEIQVESNLTLSDVLRKKLKMTGTKRGCETGECGACTVLLDGKAVRSCLILAPQVHNREVTTIEGLGTPEKLHPLQQTFIEHFAVQCGFCIPGMILNAQAFLDENPNPTKEEVKEAISGNLCRCTGYVKQVEAILAAAGKMKRAKPAETSTSEVVGRSIVRKDALEKVTGQAKYIDDMEFPRMLYAKALTSKYPHAKILKIDTSKAEKLPGVVAVVTAKDMPNNRLARQPDRTIFAEDKVRFMGDEVAAVAAESERIVEEALDLIDVQYETLPPVLDPREALKPEAPQIHPGGNLAFHRKISSGNVEKGFKEADMIIEDSYHTPYQDHCYMETHGTIAAVDASGRLTVWSTNQGPFMLRENLAGLLQLPFSKIRVVQPCTGGGFGGKHGLANEPIAALFALKTRRPVKMVWSRSEDFISSTSREPLFIDYKTGLKRDGTITAMQVKIIMDNGAFTEWSESSMTKGTIFACGPYKIPNAKVDAYLVYTNGIPTGAMRGLSVVAVTAAREAHLDNIARQLNMDPVEFRRKILIEDGDISLTGQALHCVGIKETFNKAVEASGWKSLKREVTSQ